MPRHNLYKIQPDVMKLCRKYRIPYVVKPMGRAFLDILTLDHSLINDEENVGCHILF